MNEWVCLRCDWTGEGDGTACPTCGVSLYRRALTKSRAEPTKPHEIAAAALPPPRPVGHRMRSAPVGAAVGEGGNTPIGVPPDDEGPPPALPAAGASSRWAVIALALLVTASIGGGFIRLTTAEPDEAPAGVEGKREASTPLVSPSPTPAGIGPVEPRSIGRHELTVDGVPFSFRVPTPGWEGFGSISINKSIEGSQGAETMFFWTSFPHGEYADPCVPLRPPLGATVPSVADLAATVSTAPGTELVTGPTDVTVGGRPAKHVVLAVRENAGCDPGFFFTWRDRRVGALFTRTTVGDTIRLWIVDVDGTRIFLEAVTTEQADPDLEREIRQIVGSIRFK